MEIKDILSRETVFSAHIFQKFIFTYTAKSMDLVVGTLLHASMYFVYNSFLFEIVKGICISRICIVTLIIIYYIFTWNKKNMERRLINLPFFNAFQDFFDVFSWPKTELSSYWVSKKKQPILYTVCPGSSDLF